jgi:hypothetical protein
MIVLALQDFFENTARQRKGNLDCNFREIGDHCSKMELLRLSEHFTKVMVQVYPKLLSWIYRTAREVIGEEGLPQAPTPSPPDLGPAH